VQLPRKNLASQMTDTSIRQVVSGPIKKITTVVTLWGTLPSLSKADAAMEDQQDTIVKTIAATRDLARKEHRERSLLAVL
jgi:gamma-glutamylcysteine synthetase